MPRPRFLPSVPTTSLNEPGSFACLTKSKQRRDIIDRRKNPRAGIVARYKYVLNAICDSIGSGGFIEEVVEESFEKFKEADFPGDNLWPSVRERNITLMRRFRNICEKASPPCGTHERKRQGEYFEYNGLQISALPDIVTLCPKDGLFTYTKFRFSEHKYTWDASEFVLLILQKYGRFQEKEYELKFDMKQCKFIDCAAQVIFEGHKIGPKREEALDKAVENYNAIWPTILKKEKPRS